jgi:hypothetical protein
MKTEFELELTADDNLSNITKFVNKLNELAGEKGVGEIMFETGFLVGFNDGGHLTDTHKAASERFKKFILDGHLTNPQMISFILLNTARYALLSHNLFDVIKTGRPPQYKETGLLLAAS